MAPSIASHAQSISFKAEDRKITRPFPPPLPPALTPCLPSPWCSALASARTPHAVPPGAANASPRSPPGSPRHGDHPRLASAPAAGGQRRCRRARTGRVPGDGQRVPLGWPGRTEAHCTTALLQRYMHAEGRRLRLGHTGADAQHVATTRGAAHGPPRDTLEECAEDAGVSACTTHRQCERGPQACIAKSVGSPSAKSVYWSQHPTQGSEIMDTEMTTALERAF